MIVDAGRATPSREALAEAIEKLQPACFLEFADNLGDSRLGEPEFFGRSAHAAGFGDRYKNLQPVKVDLAAEKAVL